MHKSVHDIHSQSFPGGKVKQENIVISNQFLDTFRESEYGNADIKFLNANPFWKHLTSMCNFSDLISKITYYRLESIAGDTLNNTDTLWWNYFKNKF